MSLMDYQIFNIIVSTGNLKKAADLLHLTPSAVSHSLLKLEQEFGMPLLVRGRCGIELTKNGREILPYIRNILICEEKLQGEVVRLNGVLKGAVKLGTFNSVCCCWIPPIIKQIHAQYPNMEVSVIQGGYQDQEIGLESGQLNLAFVSLPIKNTLPAIPLMRDRLLCITSADFITENPEYITIDEMRNQNMIVPGAGYDFDTVAFLKENNISTQTLHKIADDSSIVAMVESGLGISVIPELVLKKVKGNINIYPIENAPFRVIGLATQRSEFVTPAVNMLTNLISNYIKNRYPVELPYFRTE